MDKKVKTNHVAVMALVIFVIAVVCGGVGYKIGKKMSFPRGDFAQMGQMRGQPDFAKATTGKGFGGQAGQGRRHTEGEILSVDEKGVTVKLADGSSKIVLFSDKTTFATSSTIDKSKIVVGGKVDIVGDPNTDGSVSAASVQLIN